MDNYNNRQPRRDYEGGGGGSEPRRDYGGGGGGSEPRRDYGGGGGGSGNQDRNNRGPPQQRYDNHQRNGGGRDDRRGYQGGGGGDRNYGHGRGGYQGGNRGGDGRNGAGGGGGYQGGSRYDGGDRKRSAGGYEHDQRAPKRPYPGDDREQQPPESVPEPMPLDIDIDAAFVGGQQGTFNWKSLPGTINALKRVTLHGNIQYLTAFEKEMAMFIGSLNQFFKKGAYISSEPGVILDTSNTDVISKMKSITAALLMNCELLQLTESNMNLLLLPDLVKVPEIQLIMKAESILDIGSIGMRALFDWLHGRKKVKKGLKKLCLQLQTSHPRIGREFVNRLRTDSTSANYIIRLECSLQMGDFLFQNGEDCTSELKKISETLYVLSKYPIGQTSPEVSTVREIKRGVPEIMLTNKPKTAPSAK